MINWSGNNFMDNEDKRREEQEKSHTDFYCNKCKKVVKEDIWHWGSEICLPCWNKGDL